MSLSAKKQQQKKNSWLKSYYPFPKKLKTELSYNPAILLLGISPEKTIIQKDTCTPVFTAAPVTIAKTQKHPKRPSAEKQRKMWYPHTMEHYSARKRRK